MSHMGRVSSDISFNPDAPPKAYTDPTVHAKVRDYTEAVRTLHGSDYELSNEPLHAEVIVRLGQGKKHGRLWIADGAVSSTSTPSLSLRSGHGARAPAFPYVDGLLQHCHGSTHLR
jgi:hypothetical protein